MAVLCDLHLSKNYRWLSCNGNQYGGLTHLQEKSEREECLKILSISGVIEAVSFQLLMNICEYLKKCTSYGHTGTLMMPDKSKIPLNHCHQCHLAYRIVSVAAFPHYLHPHSSASSLHGAHHGIDTAHLSGSPYTLMPFVRFSFLHFLKTCFLHCAEKTLIAALNVLSKKGQSCFLLFHSPSSCQLTFITLPLSSLYVSSWLLQFGWICSNSFPCHCSMCGMFWSLSFDINSD